MIFLFPKIERKKKKGGKVEVRKSITCDFYHVGNIFNGPGT